MGLKLDLGLGVNSGNGVPSDYALEFNGTDEYLQIALPAELITNGTFETNVTGWSTGTTTSFAQDTESGKQGNYCAKWVYLSSSSIATPTLNSNLVIGQKYKVKLWYKATTGLYFKSGNSSTVKTLSATSEWNYVSFTFTAVQTFVSIWAATAGTAFLDNISLVFDQGFDLNKDQEMILHSKNWDFEGSTTDWAGTGNHSVSLSTLDKSSGTQSLLVSASGAGSSGSNYVTLPSANLESCVSGKKYTLEGDGRLDPASLTYGANLLSGDGTSGWNVDSGTGGVVGGEYVLSSTTTGYIYRSINIAAGKTIKVVFKAKATSYTGLIRVYHGSSVNAINTTAITTGYVTYTVYTIAQGNQTLYVQLFSSHTGDIYFDDIEIYEATPITLTAQLGTKSVTSSALSIVAGTFTKFVLNFEATASEVNQDLKLWLSGAGNVFVDKLSLTQAYDSQTYLKIKPTETAKRTVYNIDALNFLEFRADGKIGVSVSDGTNTVTNIAEVAYTPNEWIELLIELNRTGNVKIIKGTGTPTGTAITTVGKIIKTSTTSGFRIGANASAGETVKGQITKMIRTRYDNLTGYSGSEEMLRVTFQDGSSVVNCLKDYSPKAHTVSGVLVDITNRKRVTR